RLALGSEQLAFLAAGRSHVELIADGTAGRATGVIDHLAFDVDDLDGWVARLRERGVQLLDEAPVEVRSQLSERIDRLSSRKRHRPLPYCQWFPQSAASMILRWAVGSGLVPGAEHQRLHYFLR